jgi:hypothetical protein
MVPGGGRCTFFRERQVLLRRGAKICRSDHWELAFQKGTSLSICCHRHCPGTTNWEELIWGPKHVHDSEGREENEGIQNQHQGETLLFKGHHQVAKAVHQRCIEKQLMHCFRHIGEEGLTWSIIAKLDKGNSEYVEHNNEQSQRQSYRTHGSNHALDDDEQFWHCSQQSGHSRHAAEPQQAGHAQDSSTA